VRRLALIAALAAALAPGRAGAEESCGPLFVIARSLNANVVLYEAAVRPDGALDPEKPVRVTWRLDAQDGRREGLNFVERIRAYGVDVTRIAGTDAWRVKVRALPTRKLVLHAGTGCPFVTAEVGGRDAILRRVFVTATGGLLPKVTSVDLSGVDVETALPVTERFVPSRP
jgi:hypothetical protein